MYSRRCGAGDARTIPYLLYPYYVDSFVVWWAPFHVRPVQVKYADNGRRFVSCSLLWELEVFFCVIDRCLWLFELLYVHQYTYIVCMHRSATFLLFEVGSSVLAQNIPILYAFSPLDYWRWFRISISENTSCHKIHTSDVGSTMTHQRLP